MLILFLVCSVERDFRRTITKTEEAFEGALRLAYLYWHKLLLFKFFLLVTSLQESLQLVTFRDVSCSRDSWRLHVPKIYLGWWNFHSNFHWFSLSLPCRVNVLARSETMLDINHNSLISTWHEAHNHGRQFSSMFAGFYFRSFLIRRREILAQNFMGSRCVNWIIGNRAGRSENDVFRIMSPQINNQTCTLDTNAEI